MNPLDTSLVIALVAQAALKKLMTLAGQDELELSGSSPEKYTLDVTLDEAGEKVIVRLLDNPEEQQVIDSSEEAPCEALVLDLLGTAVANLMAQLNLKQIEIPLSELQATMQSPGIAAGLFVPKSAATLRVKKLS